MKKSQLCLISFMSMLSGALYADISFQKGWNDADNSNVHEYTTSGATTFLELYSDEMKKMIQSSSKCMLQVTKGCHQPSDPHFTVNGLQSKSTCNNTYAGSRSIHIPCN